MSRIKRWYKGFSYKGNPKQLVEQISKQVQHHDISQFIPLLRLEKGAKANKLFYFFLAIESPEIGVIPPKITESNLLQLPFFRVTAVKGRSDFTYEQIKPMVGAAHDVHAYTTNIPYRPMQEVDRENPFNFIASPPLMSLSDIDDITHRHEQLLYWLSALSCGTWDSFKKACNALKLEEPKRILRRLKLLGHIESSGNGSRWSIAPTTLLKVGAQLDLQEFVLCGQRSMKLIDKLKQYAKLELINQPRGEAPPCVRFQIDKPENLSHLIAQINREFPITNVGEVSSQLAALLPDLAVWKQSLRSLRSIVPSLYEWKRFEGNNFVSCISPTQTGMYEIWTKDSRPLHTFYDQESNLWFQGDWYGLRFLALQHNGQECIARYDRAKKILAIHLYQRVPEIYERSLILASGILPNRRDSWLFYENVDQEVVNELSAKLNLKCNEVSTDA